MLVRAIVPSVILAALLAVHAKEPAGEPDVAAPYAAAKSAPVTYDVDFRVIVTAPSGTKTLMK